MADRRESDGVVLVLGPESLRSGAVQAVNSLGLAAVQGALSQARGLAREQPWDACVLMGEGDEGDEVLQAATQLRLHGVPVVVAGESTPALEEVAAVVASPQAAAAHAVEKVHTGARGRTRALLGAVEAAFGADPESLHRALVRLAPAFPADRCSLILLEGEPGLPTVVATSDQPAFRRPVDLERYPELRAALRSAQPVLVRDAPLEPLFADVRPLIGPVGVRSVLVVPLPGDGEILGALFARLKGRPGVYGAEALALGRSAATALAGAVRSARRERVLVDKGEELEAAWEGRVQDLELANRRLQDIRAFKDEVVCVVAHDVRGPLNILMGHAKLLTGAELEKQDRASVEAIQKQARRILELADALVEQGKGEASRPVLVPADLDLASACRELVAEHEILGAERGVSIQVEAPPRLKLVADGLKLRQTVQVLLANAIARAREGGHVRVQLAALPRPDGEWARVSVTDDGANLDPKELPALFERFRGRARVTSLGLVTAREFVELHGGEVFAEGTTFGFQLPGVNARLPGHALHPPTAKPLVLLVEDEPAIAAIAEEILRLKYRVQRAQDGAEALALAREFHPDVVVMDVFLPRLDGLDATSALKSAPDTRDIPVLLVSAHRGVADKVRALELGAVDYLAKPFEARTLLDRVEAVLSARRPAPVPSDGKASGVDPATGLLDRSGFLRRFAQEVSRARRYGHPVTLVGFRPERPVEGTALGAAAASLRAGLRAGDLMCHLGDGRFVVCLPNASLNASGVVSTRLAEGLAAALGVPTHAVRAEGLALPPEEALVKLFCEPTSP